MVSVKDKKEVLASFLDVPVEDIEDSGWDNATFEVNRKEYMVLTEDEANRKAREYIEDSLWAFNTDFIIDHSDLSSEAEEMVRSFQSTKCESANDTIRSLIKDMDEFVQDAIDADGRAHFLNTYNGDEDEQDGFFIYRVN